MSRGRIEVLDSIGYELDPGEVVRLLGYVPGRRAPAAPVARRIEVSTAPVETPAIEAASSEAASSEPADAQSNDTKVAG